LNANGPKPMGSKEAETKIVYTRYFLVRWRTNSLCFFLSI